MSYSPPVITAAGLTVPSFTDIQSSLISSYRAIYGSSTYLGNDSADYQWISALSLKLSDNCGLCQLAYNARSPLTAIGADLDSVVKINGLARLSSAPSTVILTLSGVPGTVVGNAVVADVNGVLWQLPTSVTIGIGGTVNSTATCQQNGPIQALPNTVNTPVGGFTAGWTAVTNPNAANVGTPVESDSNLRARQSISVALPSQTRVEGTEADLRAVPGVTHVSVLENQTNVTDSYGNTGHSITCVVQGGTDLDIATAIYNNKSIGCNTMAVTDSGALAAQVIVPITDPSSGVITNIGFIRAVSVPIYVDMDIHPLTAAYNSAMQDAIKAAVANYLNSLQIGEEVTQSALYGAALSVMPDLTKPDFSIRAMRLGTAPSPTGTTDLVLAFYQLSSGDPANVTINSV
jgi:uncharacterized phage protein gp47/JayE